jgi:hypothetical protein
VAEPGPPLTEAQLGERDHFLTGRWRAFSTIAGRLAHVPVEHQPWPLRSVRMLQVDEKPAHRRRSPTAGRGAVGALLAGCRRALRPSSVLTVDDPTDQGATKGLRWRFDGEIAAFGTATGHRVVVGRWPVSPFGPVADIMLEVPDATRLLIASSDELADFVASIYSFDAVAVEPVEVIRRPGLLSVATRQLRT